jgi:hypothetical protein
MISSGLIPAVNRVFEFVPSLIRVGRGMRMSLYSCLGAETCTSLLSFLYFYLSRGMYTPLLPYQECWFRRVKGSWRGLVGNGRFEVPEMLLIRPTSSWLRMNGCRLTGSVIFSIRYTYSMGKIYCRYDRFGDPGTLTSLVLSGIRRSTRSMSCNRG